MRRVRTLLVLLSLVVVFSMLSMGVAFATHDGPSPAFGDDVSEAPSPGPVGSHLLAPGPEGPAAPGAINGFGFDFANPGPDFTNPATAAVVNNPNCPLHYLP